ncbi:hypothetical protein PENANT_c001G02958 [Penicillium antarcticum]|uniref:GST C-terminal domain-containing protein n=1 Tax=Penicillium antarcticum TaxID=416450 RepID=A0A1V6QNF7_9EURO|nr:hypothetical protein PENANT_c001G02958 [Penicillium antarcticum]
MTAILPPRTPPSLQSPPRPTPNVPQRNRPDHDSKGNAKWVSFFSEKVSKQYYIKTKQQWHDQNVAFGLEQTFIEFNLSPHANGSLQPGLINLMFSRMNTEANPAEDIGAQVSQKRVDVNFKEMDTRLAEFPYLAGEEFTAADCMTVFSLTTLRTFAPFGLGFYPHIVKYLERISQRAGYQSLMAKAEPGMEPAILATAPQGILAC